jgi:hypothetical protein
MSWICKGGKDEYLVEMDAIRQLEMQKFFLREVAYAASHL